MTSKSYLLNRLFVLICVAMTWIGMPAYSQQSFGGDPLAIGVEPSLRSTELVNHFVNIGFNPADLESQDAWAAPRDGRPYNVGKMVPYQVNFAEEAVLVHTQDGTQVYRLSIELDGTPVGIGLYYDDFYIPQGGRLYIYTPGGNQLLGAYTYETHPEHGGFATEPLAGSQLILDYEAPEGVEMPSIEVSSVGYFYHPVFQIPYAQDGLAVFQGNEEHSDPGMERFCQINANCPEGDPYQKQKSSSVAILIASGGDLAGMCSGNLINNVNEDNTPFIITAAHCAGLTKEFTVHNSDLDKWIFGFHFEKPRCSIGDYATPTLRSMVGARMKAFLPIDSYSDGLLLQLKQKVPADYRVYYSGWDASDKDWQKGAGLHHPAGDALKVSTFEGGVRISRWNGQQQGGQNDHLNFSFKKGNTEGGSSGSPLFNEDGLQIGTLSGGAQGICVMDASYGRFYAHFSKYENQGNQYNMKHWLDPKNTGITRVEGRWNDNWQPLDIVKELKGSVVPNDPTKISLSWDAVPSHPQGYNVSYKLYRNGKLLKTLTETTYEDNVDESLTATGQIAYMVEACYDVNGTEETTPGALRTVYTGELVSQVDPTVTASGSGVSLQWDMPYNTQIVSKVDRNKLALLKAPHNVTYSFNGLTIDNIFMYDIYRLGRSPLGDQKLYIHQINLVPVEDTPLTANGRPDYNKVMRFYTRQKVYGDTKMSSLAVVVPQGTAAKKEWMSIQLSKPIELNDDYNLEAGFYCAKDYKTGAVYIDANSRDEYVNTDACLLGFEVSGTPDMEFMAYEHYSKNRMGYQAVELVVSNNPNKQPGVTSRAFTRGPLPVPFPEVKSYIIYRDGAKVHETNADTYSWTDPAGNSNSEYRVEVVYDYPNELRPIDQVYTTEVPQLYPVHFAETLQLANPTEALRVQLFNLEGVCVADFAGSQLAGLLDVSSLASGAYIAVITTPEDTTTQKLVK